MSADEIDKVLAAAVKQGDDRGRGIVFLLHTGVRIGELLALRWVDVHLDASPPTVFVHRNRHKGEEFEAKTTKGNRRIPLSALAVEVLHAQPKVGPYVWCREDGEPMTKSQWDAVCRRLAKETGVEPFGTHALRRGFASLILNRGAPLHAVQDLLGHESINTTRTYATTAESSLAFAVSFLGDGSEKFADSGVSAHPVAPKTVVRK